MAVIGYQIGFDNFAAALAAIEAQQAAQAAAILAIESEFEDQLARRYAVSVSLAPVPGTFVVPDGLTPTLIPIPAISQSWDPTLWTLQGDGTILCDVQLAGIYQVAFCASVRDSAGSAATYTWTIARGRTLSTSPVIADRRVASAQLANVNEPTGAAAGGEFSLPDSGPDREIGLFAVHTGPTPRTVTIDALSILAVRQRDLDQV